MNRLFYLFALALFLIACGGEDTHDDHNDEYSAELEIPTLPEITLTDRSLRIVASTAIIGDVVQQIGGDKIDLTTLIKPQQDVHAYQLTPNDLKEIETADIVFVNGWGLEENILDTIDDSKEIPVSAGFSPLSFSDDEHDDHDEHNHGSYDPHVWLNPDAVVQWANNISQVLSELDPENSATYQANRDAYILQVEEVKSTVDGLMAEVAAENRVMITNHDSLQYFAAQYDIDVAGTIIPSFSTSAEPSAKDVVELVSTMQDRGLCTIFTEQFANKKLANTIAQEVDGCDELTIIPLFGDTLGVDDAQTYLDYYLLTGERIATGLK